MIRHRRKATNGAEGDREEVSGMVGRPPPVQLRQETKRHWSIFSPFLLILLFIASLPVTNFLAWRFAGPALGIEDVVDFLPTYGYQKSPNIGSWEIKVSAIVYKTDSNAFVKKKFLDFVDLIARNIFRVDDDDLKVLRSRLSIFMRDFQRNKSFEIHICSADPKKTSGRCPEKKVILSSRIGPSSEDGLIEAEFSVTKDQLIGVTDSVYVAVDRLKRDQLHVDSVADESSRKGRRPVYINSDRSVEVPLIPYDGMSIISDIDDTIKLTHVGNIPLLLKHTFVKNFTFIPEVSEMYKSWTLEASNRNLDISFHYVSSSPWPLAILLYDWILEVQLPIGTMHLKKFRLELFEPWGLDLTVFNLFRNPTKYKIAKLQSVLINYPGRRFILIGDSSEKDPEIYGAVARDHRGQVVCSLIRNVTSRPIFKPRLEVAFETVDITEFDVINDADFKRPSLDDIKRYGNCGKILR